VILNRTTRESETCIENQVDQYRSSASPECFQTKVVMINENDKIIFARYNSYIMLPWFTISDILNGLDEEEIKVLVNFI
jgi:hypothetical protein